MLLSLQQNLQPQIRVHRLAFEAGAPGIVLVGGDLQMKTDVVAGDTKLYLASGSLSASLSLGTNKTVKVINGVAVR
jgi:hypothetical protein